MPKKKSGQETTPQISTDQKVEEVMSNIALASTVRNIVIHQVPKKLAEAKLTDDEKKQAIVDYRSSILGKWNKINAANAKSILDQYDKNYYFNVITWIKNDNQAWLLDAEPLISKFDIEKCCNELDLNPSDFYKYCMDLKHATPWLPGLQASINKMFKPIYSNHLYNLLIRSINAAK